MLEEALKMVNVIEESGFQAYLVGGFVRDYILGIDSTDIDINTNATPKQLKEIFNDVYLPSTDYGSVTVIKKSIRFEITTFRKEFNYKDNRRPSEVHYIDDLYEDLIRRDFTVNTICMNKDGEIIDLLNGIEDINKRVIKTVGNAYERFSEDCLRILRAVRFATTLGFTLDKETENAIISTKHLLKNLSYNRKREELDKIFTNNKTREGISLLIKLGLDKELELPKLNDITYTDSLIGIWSELDVESIYPFTSNEKSLIEDIKSLKDKNVKDPYNLYRYGLYVSCVAGAIKGIDKKDVTASFVKLKIHNRSEINIDTKDIMNLLHKEGGSYLKDIYNDLEKEILYNNLGNNKEDILKYCLKKYK